jgi:hypothetical protein
MNLTRDRVRSIGWAFVLTVCVALTMALTLRVNAVKSEVRLAERQIVSIKREKNFLETEFLTRANQQQLKSLNDVEFGYSAPTAKQYIEGERQLAALGKPRGPGAPVPLRVASAADIAEDAGGDTFTSMVSPLTGKAMAAEMPREGMRKALSASGLGARLSQVENRRAVPE